MNRQLVDNMFYILDTCDKYCNTDAGHGIGHKTSGTRQVRFHLNSIAYTDISTDF